VLQIEILGKQVKHSFTVNAKPCASYITSQSCGLQRKELSCVILKNMDLGHMYTACDYCYPGRINPLLYWYYESCGMAVHLDVRSTCSTMETVTQHVEELGSSKPFTLPLACIWDLQYSRKDSSSGGIRRFNSSMSRIVWNYLWSNDFLGSSYMVSYWTSYLSCICPSNDCRQFNCFVQ
jgi:hypothetical protein